MEEQTMAMLTRWDPFRDIARLQEDLLGRVYDERLFRTGESMGWTPSVDIYEDGEELVVRAELAGVDPKDEKENYHRVELAYGTFTRSFSLPATIDSEKIKAEAKNGVLVIHLPKKLEAKPKAIQVKVG
jgi:HSP20 family protein